MSFYQWINEFLQGAYQTGDRPRFDMARQILAGFQTIGENPDAALEMLERGRAAAEALDELWWVAFCDHWRCQVYLCKRGQQGRALALLLPMLQEIEKPFYADLPQRVCLHEDAISAFRDVDPQRYADAIQKSLKAMEAGVQPEFPCQYCLKMIEIDLEMDQRAYNRAEERAEAALLAAQNGDAAFYIPQFYAALCRIAFQQNDLQKLLHWSRSGEIFAGRMGDEQSNLELLTWYAYALRADSDAENQERAEGALQRALDKAYDSPQVPSAGFFDALAGYYELGEEWEDAYRVRETELQERIEDAPYAECLCRLKRLRLLRKMNQPIEPERERLERAAGQLENPQPIRDALDTLL